MAGQAVGGLLGQIAVEEALLGSQALGDGCRVGSATPSASTRRRSTSSVREAVSPSTSWRGVSWASNTICVPP